MSEKNICLFKEEAVCTSKGREKDTQTFPPSPAPSLLLPLVFGHFVSPSRPPSLPPALPPSLLTCQEAPRSTPSSPRPLPGSW